MKDFYCSRHNNHFSNVCIACINDIYHAVGVNRYNIEHIDCDGWDETIEFIEKL